MLAWHGGFRRAPRRLTSSSPVARLGNGCGSSEEEEEKDYGEWSSATRFSHQVKSLIWILACGHPSGIGELQGGQMYTNGP